MSMNTAGRLNEILGSAGMEPVSLEIAERFDVYLKLLTRWNGRLNLTAIRDEEGILSRHFVECIACARAIPEDISTLLDFGSGAGFPGIPIALCRPEIAVTLAESQGKKAAFLQEALRTLELQGQVFAGRAEEIARGFDCVAMRAVDRMDDAVAAAAKLVPVGGWLVLMVTGAEFPSLESVAGDFKWLDPVKLPLSEDRIVALGRRAR